MRHWYRLLGPGGSSGHTAQEKSLDKRRLQQPFRAVLRDRIGMQVVNASCRLQYDRNQPTGSADKQGRALLGCSASWCPVALPYCHEWFEKNLRKIEYLNKLHAHPFSNWSENGTTGSPPPKFLHQGYWTCRTFIVSLIKLQTCLESCQGFHPSHMPSSRPQIMLIHRSFEIPKKLCWRPCRMPQATLYYIR